MSSRATIVVVLCHRATYNVVHVCVMLVWSVWSSSVHHNLHMMLVVAGCSNWVMTWCPAAPSLYIWSRVPTLLTVFDTTAVYLRTVSAATDTNTTTTVLSADCCSQRCLCHSHTHATGLHTVQYDSHCTHLHRLRCQEWFRGCLQVEWKVV
jgi:hypothetical protein